MEGYKLEEDVALVITADKPAIDLYETAVDVAKNKLHDSFADLETKKKDVLEVQLDRVPLMVANWLCNDLFGLVKESATKRKEGEGNNNSSGDGESGGGGGANSLNHPISVEYSTVDGSRLGSLLALVINGTVSTTQAKKILSVMYYDDLTSDPQYISESRGWKLQSDPTILYELCQQVLGNSKYEQQLEQYKKGGKHVVKMEKFFLGKIMAESRGNAHPEVLADVLKCSLEELVDN
eukprot:1568520-Ditylum_brightwellii.AAC.1